MPVELIGLIGIICMFVFMFFGLPIAISMALPAIVGIFYLKGWTPLRTALDTIVWEHMTSYSLSTIPMFILMGELLLVSGIGGDLFDLFRKWFGAFRGGLGIATIGASAIFASASGSSLATTGTMGVLASKEMSKQGF